MSAILCIETSTTVCSVALSLNGQVVCVQEDKEYTYNHAEQIHVFIAEVLASHKMSVCQLTAVAVSIGPGSFTGLRIGVSTAKGLAYGAGIPIIGIHSLEAMANGFAAAHASEVEMGRHLLVPMIDARRMEVYCAGYTPSGKNVFPTRAEVINPQSFPEATGYDVVWYFGDGAAKCTGMLDGKSVFRHAKGQYASAVAMAPLAQQQYDKGLTDDLAYLEPFYLKDFIGGRPASAYE